MDENNSKNENEQWPVEFSAEVANGTAFEDEQVETRSKEGRSIGYIALALGILSLFVLPMFFGVAAVITGFFAFSSGSRALGGWSIALGTISFMFSLLFGPLMS